MAANTTVLIVVAVLATLALAGIVVAVGYKFRADRRYLGDTSLLDEAEHDDQLIRHHKQLADDRAKAIDSDIQAFRDRGRRRDSAARSSETAHLRGLLDDRTDRPA